MSVRPVLISGLINIETTLRVDEFPIEYAPVRYPFFGVNSTVSGVGVNIAAALTALGHEVRLVSIVGRDDEAERVRRDLARRGVSDRYVLDLIDQTATSLIAYDGAGRRAIFTDLKDIQETTYPEERFAEALTWCDVAVMCNINFSRPLLDLARKSRATICTDVHVLSDVHDDYNADFMRAADVLFMSNEAVVGHEHEFVREVHATYRNRVIVMGLGADGALLLSDGSDDLVHVPAVVTRPIVNTVGAGDALFSAFVSGYSHGLTAEAALRRAVVFAGYKIGAVGAAEGFLSASELATFID